MKRLQLVRSQLAPVSTGHVPIDVDVTSLNNRASRKECVSWIYQPHDGYSPIADSIGGEGYCLAIELRPGHQHYQKDARALASRRRH